MAGLGVRDEALTVGLWEKLLQEAFLEEVAHALALELQVTCEEQMANCFAGGTGIQRCVVRWCSTSCHVSHQLAWLVSFFCFTGNCEKRDTGSPILTSCWLMSPEREVQFILLFSLKSESP